jgi:hypothetical protein
VPTIETVAQPSRRVGGTEATDEVVNSLGWRALLPFGLLTAGGLVAIVGTVSGSPILTVLGWVLVAVGSLGVGAVSFVVARRSGRGFWRSLLFTTRSVVTALLDLVP